MIVTDLPTSLAEAIRRTEAIVGGKFTRCYEYQDTAGDPVMWVGRFDKPDGNKEYRPYHQKGGVTLTEDPEGKLPLYRLPKIVYPDRAYVLEGEKCVELAEEIGLAATTSSHGSGSAHRTDWSPLAGKDVVIIPDNNDAGRHYADDVAEILAGYECILRIVELPELEDGEDLEQFIERQGDSIDVADVIEGLAAKTKLHRAKSRLDIVCLADIEPRQIEWAWPARIPPGMVSVLPGDPDAGKSILTLDLASRISRGLPWPDGRDVSQPIGDTLILTSEDVLAVTMRPRVDAAGGDASRIHVIRGVRQAANSDACNRLALDQDLRHLEAELEVRPEVRLILIDPLDGYLGNKIDSHRKADVQQVLGDVAAFAERANIAVVGIVHLRKQGSGKALYKVMGSLGFTSAPRASWAVTMDQDDPTHNRRLMTCIGMNIAPKPDGMSFTLDTVSLPDGILAPRVIWGAEAVTLTADEAMGGTAKKMVDEVGEWLERLLVGGEIERNRVFELAADKGYCKNTIYAASNNLDVRKRPKGQGKENRGTGVCERFPRTPLGHPNR